MHHPSRLAAKFAATLLVASVCTSPWAQESTTLLKGNKVTESNLLDALTPPPEPVVTRSLKVSRDNGAGVLAAPKKKPSASLLITFETNSSELTAAAKQQLDVVAAALKNDRLADYTFNVEGHADPRGSAEANLVLSQQRAESVRSYLVTEHNIAADRLKAEGKGDTDLLNRKVPTAPENRRVTIVTNAP
ncbi:MAG: OmpA family protein [Rhizobacter sp.]|nr:OmpA family protein [Rhizobacter sp.]